MGVKPPCFRCDHYHHGGAPICEAFPQGIPIPIRSGRELHETVHPEQVGEFVFSSAEGDEAYEVLDDEADLPGSEGSS